MNNPPEDGEPPSYPHPMPELTGSWDPKGPFVFSAKGHLPCRVVALGIMLAAVVALCVVAVWAVA